MEVSRLMGAMANSGVLWILLFAVIVLLYFLPTLIGAIRGVDNLALVFLVNLIGGVAFVGWPAALILAFGPRRLPPESAWPRQFGPLYGAPGTWSPGPWDGR
jgi:Superinfection immunity protein